MNIYIKIIYIVYFMQKITIIRNKYTWKYLVVCNFIYNFAAKLV